MGWVEEDTEADPATYVLRVARPFSFAVRIGDVSWPCQKPPWGTLTAVDADTGQVAWRRPLGLTEGLPAEKRETGRPGRASAIVTAGGLAFIAATDDRRFRALDVETGEELWSLELPLQGNANPMTYVAGGRPAVRGGGGDGRAGRVPVAVEFRRSCRHTTKARARRATTKPRSRPGSPTTSTA